MDKRRMVSICLTVGMLLGATFALVGCGKGYSVWGSGYYNNGGDCGSGYNGVAPCSQPGYGTPQSRAYHYANQNPNLSPGCR